jgi:Domain of unknown function (DUF4136)
MKRFLLLIISLAFLFSILGCASMSVQTDYDEEVDFSSYKTFAFMKVKYKHAPKDKIRRNLTEKRLKLAVEHEMTTKGYKMIEGGRPDIRIIYHIDVKNRIDVDHYGYRGWRRPRGTVVRKYKEGTLVIDFVDPSKDQLVWRGLASGVAGNPEKMEKLINDAVTIILAEYPPE